MANTKAFHLCLSLSCALALLLATPQRSTTAQPAEAYEQLKAGFTTPDHARWGEVPLWWWEGDPMTRERITWQLETLAAAGVKSVCPIQRSPGRCEPQAFSPEWWELFEFVHQECRRLGMTLWAYDQVGYGHYGWLEKAAAQTPNADTQRVQFFFSDGRAGAAIGIVLPRGGRLLDARAYPLLDGIASDADSLDLRAFATDDRLEWTPPTGGHDTWRVAASVAVDDQRFQLNPAAGEAFIDMFYGELERRLGSSAMGTSFAGVFQDEHPTTPRDVYTPELAAAFQNQLGYDIARAIPALHFDVGPRTPKYRSDFFDVYLQLDEAAYWKKIYDWTRQRGLLTSHDNWGRNDINAQSQGYIDYFRTQRWFSAPGYDDYGIAPVHRRNYYDTKIAASIARLYQRPRVWSESFHSSGWGRTTEQTITWLSANFAFGANLYDEHGLYYSTRASTWEHAAPDPHWRQPYWRYYSTLSDWVARMSFLMSQGQHVVDAAVHYPVVSLLAGAAPGQAEPDYNTYMELSRTLFDAGIDNDIIDDDSILNANVRDGRLVIGGNAYQALVFGPETTMRKAVLEKAQALAEAGGTVLFSGSLPTASTDTGRNDPELARLITELLGAAPTPGRIRHTENRGTTAFLNGSPQALPELLSANIHRDFIPNCTGVYVTHRKIDTLDLYLVQNVNSHPITLEALCRVDGVPEQWDPLTGAITPVDQFQRTPTGTLLRHRLEGNVANIFLFRPGPEHHGFATSHLPQPEHLEITLSPDWDFSLIPTRDNRWGEFRWPPSDELIGAEIRSFQYREESEASGLDLGWHQPGHADQDWTTERSSIGPYWLCLPELPVEEPDLAHAILESAAQIHRGAAIELEDRTYRWEPVAFSKSIGRAEPAPWGGHSGYPDGTIEQDFIQLPPGRKLLFTHILSPKSERLGLRVELRNSTARLWVNGIEQPFEDAVGNLPLNAGRNQVLLDLPDGGRGMLYVQREPPSTQSLAEGAHGRVQPELAAAAWIRGKDPADAFLRKSFHLNAIPAEARLNATAYTGYRLFVNGIKLHEEIGPWAQWTRPESIAITRYLREGENVIAAWTQVHADLYVGGEAAHKALALAMKLRMHDGSEQAIASDASWQAHAREIEGWNEVGFDDTDWSSAVALGRMGDAPWGSAPLENQGLVTEPLRALAIHQPSPYLTCFDETPEIIYDIKREGARRVGWYRFTAPPGLNTLRLPTSAPARVWVDGNEIPVRDGIARMDPAPAGTALVAVRLDMSPGAYGGAAFDVPPAIEIGGGKIQTGLWSDFALPTYSGIGVYSQVVHLDEAQLGQKTTLDLGRVLVAAEVLVNGHSAGVRLAAPFRFELDQWLRAGDNTIEIRVANTIAPHYTVTNRVENLGATESGLLGPVVLIQQLASNEWRQWAQSEITRLDGLLASSSQDLAAAQRQWERTGQWQLLLPADDASRDTTTAHDGWVKLPPAAQQADFTTLMFETETEAFAGLRLDITPPLDARPELTLTAHPLDRQSFRGRYVRIDIPDRVEYLHLAEVEVFQDDANIAGQGRAEQSSLFMNAAAALAIDGNTDGNWAGGSVSHTHSEHAPWWELDLGRMQNINRIVVHNRIDGGLAARLQGYRITILDADRQMVWQRDDLPPATPSSTFFITPIPIELDCIAAWQSTGGQRQTLLFQSAQTTGFPNGTRLEMTLRPTGAAQPSALRTAVMAAPHPIRHIPDSIAAIVAAQPRDRTPDEAETLAAYYRDIAPELESIRSQRSRLAACLRAME